MEEDLSHYNRDVKIDELCMRLPMGFPSKHVIIFVVVVFELSSLLCGVAPTMPVPILGSCCGWNRRLESSTEL
jgi:hypothetical protein